MVRSAPKDRSLKRRLPVLARRDRARARRRHVRTTTAIFRVLFVFVVLSHERRRVVHFGVTEHPAEEWTMKQMREAFPWDQAPRYVLRDRDAIYGSEFAAMIRDMGMEEVLTAPRSPWQNPFAERLVGSIRRRQ